MTVNAKDPIKYLEVRIGMLNEELKKNSSNGNDLILNKSISELSIVLDLLKRNRLLSGEVLLRLVLQTRRVVELIHVL